MTDTTPPLAPPFVIQREPDCAPPAWGVYRRVGKGRSKTPLGTFNSFTAASAFVRDLVREYREAVR